MSGEDYAAVVVAGLILVFGAGYMIGYYRAMMDKRVVGQFLTHYRQEQANETSRQSGT